MSAAVSNSVRSSAGSAAFGRLRIDSPSPSLRSSQQIRAAADGSSSPALRRSSRLSLSSVGVGASLKQSATTGEQTSLLAGQGEAAMEAAAVGIEAPPVYIWIGPALICALAYALYNIFIKKGSSSIHPILGGVILQFVAAILGTCLLVVLIAKDGWSTEDLNYDKMGILWSICAGAAVGAAEILSFCVSGMGVQAMQSIPIIIGGSVLFGTCLGWALLHEALTATGWFGVLLIGAGISLVGIDPGGAGSVH